MSAENKPLPREEPARALAALTRFNLAQALKTMSGESHGLGLPDEDLASVIEHLEAIAGILERAPWALRNRRALDALAQHHRHREACSRNGVRDMSTDPDYLAFRVALFYGQLGTLKPPRDPG